jgi:hypothetical protein
VVEDDRFKLTLFKNTWTMHRIQALLLLLPLKIQKLAASDIVECYASVGVTRGYVAERMNS